MLYQSLLDVYNQRQSAELELNKKKSDFNESIALEQAQLDDLKLEEAQLREEACLKLEQEGKSSESLNGKVICRQVKLTNKITDIYALAAGIKTNSEKILEIGINPHDLLNSFTTQLVITDKNSVNDLIEKFYSVEGVLLPGIETTETKFITIRNE